MPALRDRTEDIPLILRKMAKDSPAETPVQLISEAFGVLKRYDWPGNVRELRNFHDRAQVLFRNRTIDARDAQATLLPTIGQLGADPAANTPCAPIDGAPGTGADMKTMILEKGTVDLRAMLQRVEHRMIETALDISEGCISQAASMLHTKRTTLIGRIQKLGIRNC